MSTPLPPLTPDVASAIARKDPVLSQNTEPGFANTYGPGSSTPEGRWALAIPPAAMSAAGLYWLYRKYQQDKLEKEKQAAVDWQAVRAQMPGLHAPDLLLGGAAGAGAGMLYDYIRGSEKGKRLPTALRRILTGAALGAGATNLAGDRFRRYLTNSVVPAGYDSGNILSQLKPRSMQHVYDAAIKDKPSYDPKAVREFAARFRNTEIGDKILAARRELKRIGFGVDTHSPATSFWQKNPGKDGPAYYSVNEKNPEYKRNLMATMLPARLLPEEVPALKELFRNPQSVAWLNNPTANGKRLDPTAVQTYLDMFGSNSLVGGQQLVSRPNAGAVDVTVLDRDDVTASKNDKKHLAEAFLGRNMLSSTWRNAPRVNPEAGATGQTNAQAVNSTFARMLWDRVLSKENPWVSQKFRFSPLPDNMRQAPDTPEYGMELLNEAGAPVLGITQPELRSYLGGQ